MKISFKYISYFFLFVLGLSMTLTSCTDDLNVTPKDDDEFLSETFFQDPESYKQVLAKLYAGLYVGGNDGDGDAALDGSNGGEKDPMYDQAVEVVLKNRKASISLVQRHLKIGYNRAARLVEDMEKAGLVSSMSGSGQREILVPARNE